MALETAWRILHPQHAADRRRARVPHTYNLRHAGTSPGINIAPGSDDDGWVVPPPVTLADSTRVQLYKDGEALHAAFDAIKHAKHRVCLESYIFADDTTGNAFAELLAKKASEGVRVYLIYDSVGSLTSRRILFRNMQRAGVQIRTFHPINPLECRYSWRPFNRDHRKLLIVDYDIAGIGGLNVGAEYAGSWVAPLSPEKKCAPWRDNAIGLVGPSARYFLRPFARMWNYISTGGRIRKAEFTHNLDFAHGDLAIMASVPTISSPLRPYLHNLFRNARESIQMTMAYFAPPDDLIDDLCHAAKRGVRVQLMLPGECDVKLLITAARSFYERLLTAGVEVYERCGAILHAKTLCVDRRISQIGSTNLDFRSIEYNCEISTLIRSEEFGHQMSELFHNDTRYADRVTLRQWRRRPWRDRAVQWAVNRSRYLL
jgi:cardiolipin synthase